MKKLCSKIVCTLLLIAFSSQSMALVAMDCEGSKASEESTSIVSQSHHHQEASSTTRVSEKSPHDECCKLACSCPTSVCSVFLPQLPIQNSTEALISSEKYLAFTPQVHLKIEASLFRPPIFV